MKKGRLRFVFVLIVDRFYGTRAHRRVIRARARGMSSENDDGHAASSREVHSAASDMREKSETLGGMINNRLRF
jgi:hypothetical protein